MCVCMCVCVYVPSQTIFFNLEFFSLLVYTSVGHDATNGTHLKTTMFSESLRGLMDKASASYTPDRLHDCDSRGLRVRVPSEVLFFSFLFFTDIVLPSNSLALS